MHNFLFFFILFDLWKKTKEKILKFNPETLKKYVFDNSFYGFAWSSFYDDEDLNVDLMNEINSKIQENHQFISKIGFEKAPFLHRVNEYPRIFEVSLKDVTSKILPCFPENFAKSKAAQV